MTATGTMTSRERWLAALANEPVDRLPFWPKLGGNYLPAQDEPFRSMSMDAFFDWLGCDRHHTVPPGIRAVRPHTSFTTEKTDDETMVSTWRAPGGEERRLVQKFDSSSRSWHPVQHPVREAEDLRILAACYRDTVFEPDEEGIAETRAIRERRGESGLYATFLGESPLMYWVEYLAGVENAHFLLADCEEEVEDLFDAMHGDLLRAAEAAAAHCGADAVYLVENTSTTLISPEQYARYCARHIPAYANPLRRGGQRVILHMCGHLRNLLPQLARMPVDAFEAFTSPTVGDATFLDGREACPEICLIGGTNATLWTRPDAEIIDEIRRRLDELPHHRGIVVTSAGVLPPVARPETLRAVFDFVRAYPARMDGGA